MSPDPDHSPHRFYIKIQFKLAIVFSLIFSIAFAIAFYWFYTYAVGVAKTHIQTSLTNALNAGVAKIDGDAFTGLYTEAEPTLFTNRDTEDEEDDVYYTDDQRYWEIAEWLKSLRTVDPNAIPWTFVRPDPNVDPKGFYYVVDGLALDSPLPEDVVGFKEYDTVVDGNLFFGLERTSIFLDDPYEWEGSWWVSGYAPIKNAAGTVVGGLGIDYRAQYISDVESRIRNLAIPIFIATYLIVFFLVYIGSRLLSRPIVRLTKAAEQIGKGNYNLDLADFHTSRRIEDEIDTLTQAFIKMVRELQGYNKTLEKEVEKQTKEIREQLVEMERLQKITIDRELKMIQMKKELDALTSEKKS